MQKHLNKKGFTLIELLVVIAIIGILASTVLSSLNSAREVARDSKRIQEIKQLMTSLELYRNNNGGYPCSGTAVISAALVNCTNGADNTSNSTVTVKGTSYSGLSSYFQTALGYAPTVDTLNTVYYRVASVAASGATSDNSNRLGYIIYIDLEKQSPCVIRVGVGALYNSWGTTSACTFLTGV